MPCRIYVAVGVSNCIHNTSCKESCIKTCENFVVFLSPAFNVQFLEFSIFKGMMRMCYFIVSMFMFFFICCIQRPIFRIHHFQSDDEDVYINVTNYRY